ncbi:hypothetical protein [Vibrio superstes]
MFKKRVGTTPNQYRNSLKSK